MLIAHAEHAAHWHLGELVLYVLPVAGAVALGLGGLMLRRVLRRDEATETEEQ